MSKLTVYNKIKIWNHNNVKEYDLHNEEVLRYFLDNIDVMILKYVKVQHKLLEIGCGTGRFIQKSKKISNQIFGLDISIKMLEQAKEKEINNIVCGIGENISFKNGIFDVVVGSYYSFRWLNRDTAYKEINRVLKNEGILIFDIPNYYSYRLEALLKNLKKCKLNSKGKIGFDKLNLKNISKEKRILKSHGFNIVKVSSTIYLPFLRRFINTYGMYYSGYFSKLGYDYIFVAKKVRNIN